MDWCGLRLDAARNAAACGREARIGTDAAACDVYVITVDEASVIAQETYRCLTHAD
jgi:acetate kinase